jgi:hypothetical protein
MSKFWAGSDTESESDNDYSDDVSNEEKPAGLAKYMDSDDDFSGVPFFFLSRSMCGVFVVWRCGGV